MGEGNSFSVDYFSSCCIGRNPDSYRRSLSCLSICIVTQQSGCSGVHIGPTAVHRHDDMRPNDCHHHMAVTGFVAHVTMDFAASGSVSPPVPQTNPRPPSQALRRHSCSSHGVCGLAIRACSCAVFGALDFLSFSPVSRATHSYSPSPPLRVATPDR
jgi:hypothetical protein